MGKAKTSAEPVPLSATSNLHVPEGQKDGGRAKKVDREKMGKAGTSCQVQFLTVSHWSPVPSSMPGMIREREKEKERKSGLSNSSDLGTPQRKRNCLLHCQPMEKPVSSPLNIKHKHNVHTSLFYKATSPDVGIRVYNNRDNYTPSYLHVALGDNNNKAFYRQDG